MDVPQSFHRQQWPAFDEIFRVNFYGTTRLLHAAWPHLREAACGRALVSVSTAGLYGNHGQAAYSAAKAGLVGLVKSLAIECARSELRVNALAPYAVTPLTQPWFPQEDAQRFGPDAVAGLAAWLVSPECTLNGRVLISGGGGVRLAEALETGTVSLGEDMTETLAELVTMVPEHLPASASAEFDTFADSLGRAD